MSDSNKYKKQLDAMFQKNSVLINENQQLREENEMLKSTIAASSKIIKDNKEKWKYLESRFVQVDFCTETEKCPYYPIDCQGDKCKSFIDMVDLLDKACANGLVH